MQQSLKVKGHVKTKIIHLDGRIEVIEKSNLVVNNGLDQLSALLRGAGTGTSEIINIGFGTDGTAPTGSDTGLTGTFDKVLDGNANPTLGQAEFYGSLDYAENNGVTIQEYGLFCADASLFSRVVQAPIAKTASVRLEVTWTITFSI